MSELRTAYRTCPLCEATCGLEITLDGDRVKKIRGDAEDVFSHGFICPKGFSLKALHEDPDRLRVPLVRGPDGELAEASWDRAFEEVDRRLPPILAEHGPQAVAAYLGNPSAHPSRARLRTCAAQGDRDAERVHGEHRRPDAEAGGRRPHVRQRVERPDPGRRSNGHLLILGANPLASNGSLLTAPDMRGRLRRIGERGGRTVVVDPRRSRTAENPTSTSSSAPGRMRIFSSGSCTSCSPRDWWRRTARGALQRDRRGGGPRPRLRTEAVAAACGVPPRRCGGWPATSRPRTGGRVRTDRNLHTGVRDARELARGRDQRPNRESRPRGRRCSRRPRPASRTRAASRDAAAGCASDAGEPRTGSLEVLEELPVACLAEEIEAPGEGQIRAILTIAGNRRCRPPQRAPPARAGHARSGGQRRHVPERDDAERGRDPARPLPARAEPLRPGVHAARGTQLRQLLPAGHPTGGRRPRRVGDPPSSGRDRRRPGARPRRGGPRPDGDHGAGAARARHRDPASPARTRTSSWRSSEPVADRSGSSTSCSAPDPTATASAPTPAG